MKVLPAFLLLALAFSLPAAEPQKSKEQPFTPGGKWRAHDMERPRPVVITPAAPGEPAPPPSDAKVLFDGKDLNQWINIPRHTDPAPSPDPKWKIENGVLEIVPQSGSLQTKEKFGDSQWHLEWATPSAVSGTGQGRGNSGVLINGIGEVQVLDSFGNDTYPDGQAGAIYSNYPPLVNASRGPGQWQTYDIIVEVARLDAEKKITRPARLTVFHNGILVQHAEELPESRVQEFTVTLQDHLNPVRFRNIWVRKIGTRDVAVAPAPEKPATAQTSAHPFTRPALGGTDEGDLLLSTLNCSSCHSAVGLPDDRFPSKKAPLLGPEGLRLTPQFLRAYLTDPQTEKPGTTMPDVLHTLPAAEKSAAAEALTHFLLSVAPPEDGTVSPSENLMARGKALYHEIGCVACHTPQDSRAPELAADSVPHGDLAKKYTVPQLVALLQQPAKYRPQRRMPSLNLQKDEATAIAMYLLRSQAAGDPKAGTKLAKGVRFEFFKGEYTNCGRTLENAKPTFTGSLDEIDISRWAKEDQSFAARFSGQFEAPIDGEYTFTIESDDGSRLWIDGRELIDNDGAHPRTARSANLTLTAGTHALVLTYFQRAKTGWYLGLSYSYPGNKAKPMRGSLFTHVAGVMQPTGTADFQVDPAKAEKGRQLYGELGCASCHHTPGVKDLPASKVAGRKLLDLAPQSTAGCLADQPSGKAPDFHLSSSQLVALRKTIAQAASLQTALTPAAEIARSFNFLNCYACHARDGVGGPHGPRAEFFKSAGEVDLGDEGRIPPHLTKVGAKLKPDWTAEVLLRKGAVRPYLLTRMPQFSAPVVEKLPDLFAKADGGGPIPADPPYQHETAKLGRSLLGNTGYTCIVCHSYGKHASLGVPAIDLATAVRRLRPEWFAHYLVDPQSLRPGTRMPSFWPGGKAANPTVLGGDTEKQIAAIWMYLSKGPDGDPPPGIVKAKMELVAESTAIIYRNFIKGAGSRAIGVGYPEKANLAFDADELRLALVWQGGFIDASRHRTGRGAGFEPPLGNNVIPFPEGPAFATLTSQADTWPATATDQHFRGYSLDSLQRPTFRYTVGGVQVEDFPEAVPGQPDPSFKRSLTLRAPTPAQNLYFRAATGRKIEDQGNGVFLVDSKMRVKLTGASALIRRGGESSELLVPLSFTSGELKLTEELSW